MSVKAAANNGLRNKQKVVMAGGQLTHFNQFRIVRPETKSKKWVEPPVREYWTDQDIIEASDKRADRRLTQANLDSLRRSGVLVAIPGHKPLRYTHASAVYVLRYYRFAPLSARDYEGEI